MAQLDFQETDEAPLVHPEPTDFSELFAAPEASPEPAPPPPMDFPERLFARLFLLMLKPAEAVLPMPAGELREALSRIAARPPRRMPPESAAREGADTLRSQASTLLLLYFGLGILGFLLDGPPGLRVVLGVTYALTLLHFGQAVWCAARREVRRGEDRLAAAIGGVIFTGILIAVGQMIARSA